MSKVLLYVSIQKRVSEIVVGFAEGVIVGAGENVVGLDAEATARLCEGELDADAVEERDMVAVAVAVAVAVVVGRTIGEVDADTVGDVVLEADGEGRGVLDRLVDGVRDDERDRDGDTDVVDETLGDGNGP